MRTVVIFGSMIGFCDNTFVHHDNELGIVIVAKNFKSICNKIPRGTLHISLFTNIALIEKDDEIIYDFCIIEYLNKIEKIIEHYNNSDYFSHIRTIQ